jgi:hypothetical protein
MHSITLNQNGKKLGFSGQSLFLPLDTTKFGVKYEQEWGYPGPDPPQKGPSRKGNEPTATVPGIIIMRL